MLQSINKYYFIGAALAVVVIVAVAAYYFIFQNKPSATGPTAGAGQLLFTTDSGDQIAIKDFVESSTALEDGTVVLFNDPKTAQFLYDSYSRTFTLVYNEPRSDILQTKQPVAEAKVLQVLGVSREDACKLPIDVRNDAVSLRPYLQICLTSTTHEE